MTTKKTKSMVYWGAILLSPGDPQMAVLFKSRAKAERLTAIDAYGLFEVTVEPVKKGKK